MNAARLAGWSLVAVVLLSALPLGAARPWAWSLLAVMVGLVACLSAVIAWRDPSAPAVSLRRVMGPALLYGLALAWAWMQTMEGMPQDWLHPYWAEAAAAMNQPLSGFVSLDPLAGREGVMKLLAYGLIFFLSMQAGRSGRFAWATIKAVVLFIALLAAYGLVNVLGGFEMIGWLDKWAYRGMVTGTLVNPNHFATLIGFALVGAAALILRQGHSSLPGLLADRTAVRWLGVAALLGLALLLTQSRGGMLAAGTGLSVLLVLNRWHRDRLGAVKLAALFAVAGALLGALVIELGLLSSSAWNHAAGDRVQVFRMSLDLIADRPWLGSGLGSFSDASAKLRPVGMVLHWREAHNTYLELMTDLGLPAAFALLAAQGWLLLRCLRGGLARGEMPNPSLLAVAAGAVAATHMIVDFSLQIPAVAAFWALLLGIGVAQSWSSRKGRQLP